MNIFSFGVHFTDEKSCRFHFKEQRDKQGVVCKRCGLTKFIMEHSQRKVIIKFLHRLLVEILGGEILMIEFLFINGNGNYYN